MTWQDQAELVLDPSLPPWQSSAELVQDDQFLRDELRRADLLRHARQRLSQSWFPNLKATAVGLGADWWALAERTIGNTQKADALIQFSNAYEQAADELAQGGMVPAIIERGARNVGRTVPSMIVGARAAGPYGALGLAGVQEANRAITRGREAGLTEAGVANYALTQGIIEAGVGAVFQRFGWGGNEALAASKQVVSQGLAQALKRLGISTLQELPEELITESGHNFQDYLSGVDPKAVDLDQLGQTWADTVVATVMQSGVLAAPDVAAGAVESIGARRKPQTGAAASVANEPQGAPDAQAVRGDEGPIPAGGPVAEGGEGQGRPHLQPPAPGQPGDRESQTPPPVRPEAEEAARQTLIYMAESVTGRPRAELEAMSNEELQAEILKTKEKPREPTQAGPEEAGRVAGRVPEVVDEGVGTAGGERAGPPGEPGGVGAGVQVPAAAGPAPGAASPSPTAGVRGAEPPAGSQPAAGQPAGPAGRDTGVEDLDEEPKTLDEAWLRRERRLYPYSEPRTLEEARKEIPGAVAEWEREMLMGRPHLAQPQPAATPAAAKEPWQMKRQEWIDAVRAGRDFPQLGVNPTPLDTLRKAKDWERLDRQAAAHHAAQVTIAQVQGKSIPGHVLAEYTEPAPPVAPPAGPPAAGPVVKPPPSQALPTAKPPKGKQKGFVLWGRRGDGEWFKLTTNVSKAEQRRRKKEGWTELVALPEGQDPNAPPPDGGAPAAAPPAAAPPAAVPPAEPSTPEEALAALDAIGRDGLGEFMFQPPAPAEVPAPSLPQPSRAPAPPPAPAEAPPAAPRAPAAALPTAQQQREAAIREAEQAVAASIEELRRAAKAMGETPLTGVISRDLAIAAAHLARDTVRLAIIKGSAQVAQFSDYIREVAKAIGNDLTLRYAGRLRNVWDDLRKSMGDVMSPSMDPGEITADMLAEKPAAAPSRPADEDFNRKLLAAQPTMQAEADASWRRYPAIHHLKNPEDLIQDATAWILENKDRYDPARASFNTWTSRAVRWTAGKTNEKAIWRGEGTAEFPVEPSGREMTPADEAIFWEGFEEKKGRAQFGEQRKKGRPAAVPGRGAYADPLDILEAVSDEDLVARFEAEPEQPPAAEAAPARREARLRALQQAVAEDIEEVRRAAQQLTLFTGAPISPDLAKALGRLAYDTVRLTLTKGEIKVAQFADFVKLAVEAMGANWVRERGQDLRDAWDRLRQKIGRASLSESAPVENLLPAKEPEPAPAEAPSPASPKIITPAPAAGVQLSPEAILRQAGLSVAKVTTRNGRTAWEVTGPGTFTARDLLRELGGKYYGPKKAWTFYDQDPTGAIATRLGGRGDGSGLGDGGARPADVERGRYRRRESERPDRRGSGEEFRGFVGPDTQALIAKGAQFNIPQVVLDGQVEDIGAVTRAFAEGRPVFILGSAPGMGKTFVLGGVIRELRNRGAKKFVYVTENQELVRQVQANLAEYGLEGVEFATYASVRNERPDTTDAVLLLDEAHNAKNPDTSTAQAVEALVSDARFTVYSTATPFENVSEARYLEASGLFNGIEAEIERRDSKGHRYMATIEGFDAWAWMYGAELFWPADEERPTIYWPKRHDATEAQQMANEWLMARGVYAMRPMVLPPGMVRSSLQAVQADQQFVDLFERVVQAYADAEGSLGDGEGRLKGKIRAHGINLQKRILEASKVQEGIRRAKALIAEGKQVIIFVNTKADRAIGRYRFSDPYRKYHKIKGEAAERTHTPGEMRRMMAEYQQAKAMARRMRSSIGPAPFAREVFLIAMAMEAAGIDTSLPSVVDNLMGAFPEDQVAEYTGRLSDSQAKKQLDLWKRNERKLIVATMDKGGTGLSYHDTTGAMPERVQVNINLPWSGTQVEQVSGRLARLGTAKPVTLEWIFADNIPFERELSRTVGARMRSMQAAVQGVKSETARKIRDFDIDESPAAPAAFAAERVGQPGKNAILTLADGSKREIQYVAVEDDVIIPSHDARRNFVQNERGAKNLQRPYHDPVQGQPGRVQVEKIARADPDELPLIVSDTPSATDGPPVATPDPDDKLIVRGGNARSMGTQLAYSKGGEEAARFKQTMIDAAEKFDIDRAAVEKMQRPIIIRVLVPAPDENMPRLEKLLNDPKTAGITQASEAVSRGATLSQAAADEISMMLEPRREGQPAPSLREVLADPRKANKIKDLLVLTGVVVQRELDTMLNPATGEFNEAGKLAIEELLLAKIVANPVLVGKMTPAERRTLLASLGPITRLAAHKDHGPRFSELLMEAAEAFPEYKASGQPWREYFFQQTSIVEFAGKGNTMVAALVDAIDKLGIRGFKDMLTDVLASLGIQKKQKGLFGGEVKRVDNVDEALRNAISDKLGPQVFRETEGGYGAERLRVAPRARLGGRRVTTAVVSQIFPGAQVTETPDGWDVLVGGRPVSIRWTEGIELTPEARERLDREVDPAVRDAMVAAGSFSMTLPDGAEHDGLTLIQLVQGLGDDATLRHEALHMARALGLITDREWQTLVDEYAPGVMNELDQEERVAEAFEPAADRMGLWSRIVSWVRRLLDRLGVRRAMAREIRQLMQEPEFWGRAGVVRPASEAYQLRTVAEIMEASGIKYTGADEFAKAFRKAVKKVGPQAKGFTRTGKISEAGVRAAVAEAIEDVRPWLEQNQSHREYYRNQTARERRAIGRLFPELTESDDAWLFYKVAGAIASNSTQLRENVTEQIDAWENFRDRGRFEVEVLRGERNAARRGRTGFKLHGGSQATKAQHYHALNLLLDRFGSVGAVVEYLTDTVPASEIRSLPREVDQGELNGKQVRQIKDTVKAATGQEANIPRMFMFGPKIGAYALNNLGLHDYTTVDVWESRFWRSFFSDVPDSTGIEEDSATRELFKRASNMMAEELGLQASAGQAIRWYFMIDVARQAGYVKAQSNDTIAGYARRVVEKRIGSRGESLTAPSRAKAAVARGDREGGAAGGRAAEGGVGEVVGRGQPGGRRLREKAAQARAKADAVAAEIKQAVKDLGTTTSMGVDPKLAAMVGRWAGYKLQEGIYTFADFIEAAVAQFGQAITDDLMPYLRAEWGRHIAAQPEAPGAAGEEAGPTEQPMIVTGTNVAQTLDTNVEREPKPISPLDIIKTWEKDFDVPIRAGRLSGKPAAVYKRLFGVVRAKEEHVGNLAVHAHEIAHHVDRTEKLLRSMPDDVKDEVRKLDYEPDREDQTQAAHEGFAEFIRHYLTENDAASVAPKTYRWWTEEWLPAHPRWQEPFERAHRMAHQYAEQGVYARLRAFTSGKLGRPLEQPVLQTAKETTMNWWRRFYSKWKDQYWALHRYSQVAADKGVRFDGKESPYELAMAFSLTAPAHAFRAIWEGPHTMTGTERILAPGLREALSRLRSDEEYNEAQFFAISRLVVELAIKRPEYNPGVRLDDAEAWIREVAKDRDKLSRYTHFADSLRLYHAGLIAMLVDAGKLTPTEGRRIIESLDYYVLLVRVRPTGKESAGGGRFFNLPQAVRRRSRSGSDRQILDLVDATVQRTMRAYSLAMKQQVAKAVVETGDPRYGGAKGMGHWIEHVAPRRLLERFPLSAMLKPLVEEGVLTEDDARKIDLMSRIRFLEEEADEGKVGTWNGHQLNKDNLEWLADQLGVDIEDRSAEDIYPELIEAGSEIPDGLAMIGMWKTDYSPDPRTHIVRYRTPDGKPRMYEFDEYLYDAVMGMDSVTFGPFMQAVSEMSKAFKLGAVGLSTGFGVANIPRDWMANFQQAAEQGTLESTVSPLRWLAVYAASQFGLAEESEAVKIWSEYGGELMTRLGIDNEGLMTKLFGRRKGLRLRRQLQAQTIGDKIAVVAKHPFHVVLDLPSNIRNLISMSDVGPRLAEFVASLRRNGWELRGGRFYNLKTGTEQRPPRWAIVKAMNAASDVTTNFKRFGSIGRYVDAVWPFFNATMESMDKQFRTLGRLQNIVDPGERGRLARKLIVTISALAAASLVYWLRRRDDDDYKEREAWERLNYWTVPLTDEVTLYAPKPFDWNVIPNLIEAGAEAYTSRNPDALQEFGFETALQRLPRGGGLVRGGVEQGMNWDFYRNRPIEGEYMKYQPVELRSTKYTSELAKALSGLVSVEGTRYGLSPVRVEHLLNSTTGGAIRRWEDAAKAMLKGELEVRHVPGLRGVLKDYQGQQSVDDFYAAKADAAMEYQSAKMKGNVPADVYQHYRRLEDYEGMMTELRAAIPDGAPEEVVTQHERYILGLARDALGKEELPSFPNPLKSRNLSAAAKKIVDDYIERLRQRRDADFENLRQGKNETANEFKWRVEAFKLRQDIAEKAIDESGLLVPAKKPRAQFGRRRRGITFSFQ